MPVLAAASHKIKTALHTAFLNLIEPGDEALIPAITFFATAVMVIYAGGTPVICDIDPKTYCIDITDAKNKITKKNTCNRPSSPVRQCL